MSSTTGTMAADVVAYLLEKKPFWTSNQIQQLVYRCLAYSLVKNNVPLFQDNTVRAALEGPVIVSLEEPFALHFLVSRDVFPQGASKNLNQEQKELIDWVLAAYDNLSGRQLSELSRQEKPWREAREPLFVLDEGHEVITLDAIQDFYQEVLVEKNPLYQEKPMENWISN